MKFSILSAVVVSIWMAAPEPAPAQPALERLEALIRQQNGTVRERGYLGVVADDREDLGRGVQVLEVLPGGPADTAGLRPQDLIIGLEGVEVSGMSDVSAILQKTPVGGKLTFEILRGDKQQAIQVTLGRRPPPEQRRFKQLPAPPGAEAGAAIDKPPEQREAVPAPVPPPAPAKDLTARIELLERRVRELEQRIARLEGMLARLGVGAPTEPARPATAPVTVTVTLNGQPAEGATVRFVTRELDGHAASGITDAQGRASLTTFERGDGAVPATYRVTISKLELAEVEPDSEARHLLPRKFASPQTASLTAEVVAGAGNDFTFALTD